MNAKRKVGRWLAAAVTVAFLHAPVRADADADFGAAIERAFRAKAEGRYAEAAAAYERALALVPSLAHPERINAGSISNNLAILYDDMGQYAKAEPLYRRALASKEARLGRGHLDTASTLNNLAVLYRNLGQYPPADLYYRRALAIFEGKLGKDHPQTAACLNNLGCLYKIVGQYAEAETLLERALAIREAKLVEDHPDTASTLSNLGLVYSATGRYAKAEPLGRRALAIFEAKLGKGHPLTASAVNNLAAVYGDMGQYAKAELLFQRALADEEATLGKDHPDTAMGLNNLANLCSCMAEWDRAASYRDRARRIIRAFVAETLPAMAEKEQERFLASVDRFRFHAALFHGVLRRERPSDCDLSAAWLLNGKAVAGQARAETALLARDSRDPQVGRAARELVQVRRSLAGLTVRPAKEGDEASRAAQIADLSARERQLSRRVSQATGRAAGPAWVELAEVRKAIPPAGVLIEIARFDRTNFLGKSGEKPSLGERYAAWIIPPSGTVQIVDLGDAAPIDAAVAAARKEIDRAAATIAGRGEPAAEKQLRAPMEALAELVLHPLLPHVASAKTWVLSPDGNLWLVPWAALPLADGTYAVEGHTIEYAVAGRDLLAKKNDAVKPTAPLVLADPDFDRGLGTASEANPDPSRGLSRDFKLGNVRRLPGTAVEAEAILPHLEKYANAKPSAFTEGQATTGTFKSARNPRVVVLSTHGFFLEEDKDRKAGRAGENPLLRCGLLLAGCNNAARAEPGQDTGVLTGLEIVGTDLRGTELVVLSACETGLGDVKNGEGVAGLRQAFQLAGAESVVATLWQVPDRDSALLMASFFDKLAGKQARDAALAEAQREMIGKRRARFGAAHPYFWAAYTFTGQAK